MKLILSFCFLISSLLLSNDTSAGIAASTCFNCNSNLVFIENYLADSKSTLIPKNNELAPFTLISFPVIGGRYRVGLYRELKKVETEQIPGTFDDHDFTSSKIYFDHKFKKYHTYVYFWKYVNWEYRMSISMMNLKGIIDLDAFQHEEKTTEDFPTTYREKKIGILVENFSPYQAVTNDFGERKVVRVIAEFNNGSGLVVVDHDSTIQTDTQEQHKSHETTTYRVLPKDHYRAITFSQ